MCLAASKYSVCISSVSCFLCSTQIYAPVGSACNLLPRAYTQRNIFQILFNQPEIKLYLPCTDWFGTKRTSVWIKINRKMVNTTWFRVNLIRFLKKCLCVYWARRNDKTFNQATQLLGKKKLLQLFAAFRRRKQKLEKFARNRDKLE